MWNLRSKKMNKSFVSMNPLYGASTTRNKSRMTSFADKSFGWILFWRHRPRKFVTTTSNLDGVRGGYTISPERTALMSFDDLSTYNDTTTSHCFVNHSSSSNSESESVSPETTTDRFPSWHSINHEKVRILPTLDPKMKEETRKRRSVLYAFHNARIRSLSNVGKVERPDDDDDDGDDDESAHFSTSTDLRHQPIFIEPQRSDATSNNDTTVTTASTAQPPPPPPFPPKVPDPPPSISDTASVRTSRSFQSIPTSRSSSRSVRSAKSMRSAKSFLGSVGNRSRISLDQFLEDRTQASSLITGPLMVSTKTNLGELPADFDAMSVGTSASLDVSFHGEYPQLVLTPSVDGSASRITDGSIETGPGTAAAASASLSRVGKKRNTVITVSTTVAAATAPTTPASSSRSVASFDTNKKNVSCTPQWLNDNIDRVWKQFDQCKADPDGRYAPEDDPYYDSNNDHNDVDDHLPYNKTEPNVNVFQYKFKNGHISEFHNNENSDDEDDDGIDENKQNSDDSMDLFTTTDDEDLTDDDDIGAILDTATDDEKEQEMAIVAKEVINVTEKDDQFSFRSFSPFEDMGWSFSANSSGGKSISKMIETEVIYPILKPICELVEATEIPEARSSSTSTAYYRRHRQLANDNHQFLNSKSTSPPPPSSFSADKYYYEKNTSYRMSPRRYKRNIIR